MTAEIQAHPVQYLQLDLPPYSVSVLYQPCATGQVRKGIVILLHGFPDTRHSWRSTLDALSRQGYDCYAPSLPGYEQSYLLADDRYHFEALAAEFDRVVQAIAGERKVQLIAHDWGAALTYWYAAFYPERLQSVTTLSVPPVQHVLRQMAYRPWLFSRSFYQLRFQFAGYAERLLRRDNWAYLRRLWALWSPGWDGGEYLPLAIAALQPPAVTRASLRYYQHAFRWFDVAWYRLIRKPIRYAMPWQILYGERDGVYGPASYRHCVKPADFPVGLEMQQIPGVGHFLHLEQPELLHGRFLQFLNRHAAP